MKIKLLRLLLPLLLLLVFAFVGSTHSALLPSSLYIYGALCLLLCLTFYVALRLMLKFNRHPADADYLKCLFYAVIPSAVVLTAFALDNTKMRVVYRNLSDTLLMLAVVGFTPFCYHSYKLIWKRFRSQGSIM